MGVEGFDLIALIRVEESGKREASEMDEMKSRLGYGWVISVFIAPPFLTPACHFCLCVFHLHLHPNTHTHLPFPSNQSKPHHSTSI
jgi:hypothetical protein